MSSNNESSKRSHSHKAASSTSAPSAMSSRQRRSATTSSASGNTHSKYSSTSSSAASTSRSKYSRSTMPLSSTSATSGPTHSTKSSFLTSADAHAGSSNASSSNGIAARASHSTSMMSSSRSSKVEPGKTSIASNSNAPSLSHSTTTNTTTRTTTIKTTKTLSSTSSSNTITSSSVRNISNSSSSAPASTALTMEVAKQKGALKEKKDRMQRDGSSFAATSSAATATASSSSNIAAASLSSSSNGTTSNATAAPVSSASQNTSFSEINYRTAGNANVSNQSNVGGVRSPGTEPKHPAPITPHRDTFRRTMTETPSGNNVSTNNQNINVSSSNNGINNSGSDDVNVPDTISSLFRDAEKEFDEAMKGIPQSPRTAGVGNGGDDGYISSDEEFEDAISFSEMDREMFEGFEGGERSDGGDGVGESREHVSGGVDSALDIRPNLSGIENDPANSPNTALHYANDSKGGKNPDPKLEKSSVSGGSRTVGIMKKSSTKGSLEHHQTVDNTTTMSNKGSVSTSASDTFDTSRISNPKAVHNASATEAPNVPIRVPLPPRSRNASSNGSNINNKLSSINPYGGRPPSNISSSISNSNILSTPVRGMDGTNGSSKTSNNALPYHSNSVYTTPTSTAFDPSGRPPLAEDSIEEGNGETPPPKTPLTQMRHLMSSISKDRSEVEGARRPLFVSDDDDKGNGRRGSGIRAESTIRTNDQAMNGYPDEQFSENDNAEESWYEPDTEGAEDLTNDAFYERRQLSASCVPYGSEVVIRPGSSSMLAPLSLYSKIVGGTSRACCIANESYGNTGGISGANRFIIINDGLSKKEEQGKDALSPFLCYGDTISLVSKEIDRLVGVQKFVSSNEKKDEITETSPAMYGVGCFRRHGRFPQGDRWIILRGGANAPVVQLGTSLEPIPHQKRIPVYSGDPIVLLNCHTGGMLSIGNELEHPYGVNDSIVGVFGWSLRLITSSYEMDGGTASTEESKPLIEYMQRHNQCWPSRNETFQIIAANAPHSPDWMYPTGDGLERIFLDESYLLHQDRHTLSSDVELGLFPDFQSDEYHSGHGKQHLASLSVNVQEKMLLDEIVSAMMGLEGQFVQFQHFESLDGENYQSSAGFVLSPLVYSDGRIDSSLENTISMLLSLCSNYAHVSQYVYSCLNSYECGNIARTLCKAIGCSLQEYLSFVSNLDYLRRESSVGRHELTMSMLFVHAKPWIRTMAILNHVVSTVKGKKGGALLNSLKLLLASKYSGDDRGNEVLTHLLNESASPYVHMLNSWLEEGIIHDPYDEFMIRIINRTFQAAHISMKQGLEWVDWCRLQDDHVPISLRSSRETHGPKFAALGTDHFMSTREMSDVDKVHTTGKYWRAVHCCSDGVQMAENHSTKIEAITLFNPVKLTRCIDNSYHKASDALLHMLLGKYDLLSSLTFMKKYFLLDQGDFFVDFLDLAENELAKDVPQVSKGRVQNWLTTSIGRSSELLPQSSSFEVQSDADIHHSSFLASKLRCTFKNKSLVEVIEELHRKNSSGTSKKKPRTRPLAGIEAIVLDFERVPFPTCLVLSSHQIRSYQFIFRQIFFAKCVERQLVNMWSDHQRLKQMVSLRAVFRPTFTLRRRMIHFIQNFVYYMKFDVIEPNWRELESKLKAAKEHCSKKASFSRSPEQFPHTVDDMLEEHNQFLIRILTHCLLTNSELIRISTKIMTTCSLFSIQMKKFIETTKVEEYLEATRSERTKLRQEVRYQESKNSNKSQKSEEFRAKREKRIQRCSDRILHELGTENYVHMIDRFDKVFSANLAEFMRLLKSDIGQRSNAHLTNLFMQLDYNGFVTSSMYDDATK